ncbi:MAG: hypothetical protein R2932_33355 [Caldilineaceae bacterium]
MSLALFFPWQSATFDAYPDAIHQAVITLFTSKQRCFLQRVDDYLACGRWFRFVSNNGTISSVAKLTISAYSGTSSKPKSLFCLTSTFFAFLMMRLSYHL